ncbi:sulfurtransferase [Pseudonocardia sulfidoxydans NBRC 16205]|uniref:Sulfurtransferase n=1 Tax=Pseudonocardia sulfidoxydans NBRC 16205 TaxID=1223511 RepID=A0A511DMX1_9PSEU|nr:rhodanese-like domain-containing protein [Pseudonocardia sulfidoxydans]GEL26166.1 sulfurtransferase [Pseudonocardia sulfidoxydans NBRC 16205]
MAEREDHEPGTPLTVDPSGLAALADDVAAGDVVVLDATARLGPPTPQRRYPLDSGAPLWEAAHIPGSRHVDLVDALSDPGAGFHLSVAAAPRMAAALAAVGVRAGARVVCYDSADGSWAARLWWILRGVDVPASVLDGGLAAWRAAGFDVVSGPAEPVADPPAPLVLPGAAHGWATIDDVRTVVDGGPGTLVCALGEGQFTGAEPTRYPRPGHIPTSVNLPAHHVRDAAGRLADPDVVRAAAEPVLGPPGPQPITLYCGMGVSAAGLALSLAGAGYTGLRIYDGSLEEWTADPDRPLDTGGAS